MKALLAGFPLVVCCSLVLCAGPIVAQTPLAPRDVPAKSLPVPGNVSPEMQSIIAQPLRTDWDNPPTTPDGWRAAR